MQKASANQAMVIGALVVIALILAAALFYGPILFRNAGDPVEGASAPAPLDYPDTADARPTGVGDPAPGTAPATAADAAPAAEADALGTAPASGSDPGALADVTPAPTDPSEPAAEVLVEMTDQMRFEPASVTILAGHTVTWVNRAAVVHTVTSEPGVGGALPESAQPFDSGPIEPGQRWSHTFEVPGVYEYICIAHRESEMVGTVMVEHAEPEAGTP